MAAICTHDVDSSLFQSPSQLDQVVLHKLRAGTSGPVAPVQT